MGLSFAPGIFSCIWLLNFPDTDDRMVVQISCKDNKLEIAFFDNGKPVEKEKIKHRAIDDIKPGGLGTFFIQEIMDSIVFKEGNKPSLDCVKIFLDNAVFKAACLIVRLYSAACFKQSFKLHVCWASI